MSQTDNNPNPSLPRDLRFELCDESRPACEQTGFLRRPRAPVCCKLSRCQTRSVVRSVCAALCQDGVCARCNGLSFEKI